MAEHIAPIIRLHDAVSPSVAAVMEGVLASIDEALPGMGEAYRREVVEYAAMDPKEFAAVLATSRTYVARFCEAVAAGTRPTPDHATLVGAGRARLASGISLDAAMHAFRIASREGWRAITDAASAVDPSVIGGLAAAWIEYADLAATAFAEGHVVASHEQMRRVDARRQAVLSDLLAAEDENAALGVAARHGISLAALHIPVVVSGEGIMDRLGELIASLPDGVMIGHRKHRLVALLPVDRLAEVTDDAIATQADRLRRLSGGRLVAHGRPAAPGPELTAEVSNVEHVLDAGELQRLQDACLGPDDLILARVVHEHVTLRRSLPRRVLEPLRAVDSDRIFTETLRAYLATGSIPATAAALHVHANTVSYRLKRVAEITGLDARVPVHAADLVLALTLEGGMP